MVGGNGTEQVNMVEKLENVETVNESSEPLSEVEKQIFQTIAKNDYDTLRQLLAQLKDGVNFIDENGMTPLQHACCKGNTQIVEMLLDMGADINFSRHGANYTPLHFAALSGNTDVCRLLLDAGINPDSVNSVSRTASQMAAFVGNHGCVEVINNYVRLSEIEEYTKSEGAQKQPLVPPTALKAFHKFVTEVNLHPVRIALNLQSLGLLKYLSGLRVALQKMCETQIYNKNERLSFKFHYLSWIISELQRCETQCKAQRKEKAAEADATKNVDFIDLFIKRVLKENKQGQLEYVEYTMRDCMREFPFRECAIFHQAVSQLGIKDPPSALYVLRTIVNGLRGFADEVTYCNSCGNEKPDKKCSKCKEVQYCDRECQRLHWFMHKKTCARPTSTTSGQAGTTTSNSKTPIDVNELRDELYKKTTLRCIQNRP